MLASRPLGRASSLLPAEVPNTAYLPLAAGFILWVVRAFGEATWGARRKSRQAERREGEPTEGQDGSGGQLAILCLWQESGAHGTGQRRHWRGQQGQTEKGFTHHP